MIWTADLPLSPHGFPPTDWAGLASEASRRQHIGNPSWTWSYPSRSIRVIQNTAPMCLKLIHILSFVCCTQLLTSYCFMFFKAVVGKVSISYWFWLIICYLLDNCRKGNRHPGMSASGAGRGRRRIRRRDRWSPRVAWWIGWTCVPQYAFYRVRSAGLGNTYLHRHCFHFTFTYEVVSRQEEWRPVCVLNVSFISWHRMRRQQWQNQVCLLHPRKTELKSSALLRRVQARKRQFCNAWRKDSVPNCKISCTRHRSLVSRYLHSLASIVVHSASCQITQKQ